MFAARRDGALAIYLSSCWVLQGFTVVDYTLDAGQAHQGAVHPSADGGPERPARVRVRDHRRGSECQRRTTVSASSNGGARTASSMVRCRWSSRRPAVPPRWAAECSSSGLNFARHRGAPGRRTPPPRARTRDFAQVEKKADRRRSTQGQGCAVDAGRELSDRRRRRDLESTTVTVRPGSTPATRTSAGGIATSSVSDRRRLAGDGPHGGGRAKRARHRLQPYPVRGMTSRGPSRLGPWRWRT